MTNEKRDEMLIDMHSSLKNLEKSVTVLFKSIEGNGQPGLKQKVARLEQVQSDCRDARMQQPQISNNRLVAVSIAVAAVFSPITAMATTIIAKKMGF